MEASVLEVRGLRKTFRVGGGSRRRAVLAVDDVDLTVARGETLGLVGESGSGKSTLARCVVRLVEPSAGDVVVDGQVLNGLRRRRLAETYRSVQMVFQDPNSSLNPRMSIRKVIEEPLRLHLGLGRRRRHERAIELLGTVGLDETFLDRFPHQLSGGQRQRIGIARALAVEPKALILDEPTSSLDVSVRGQVLSLLRDIQRERGLAYLFISHDLQAVRHLADRVAVLYLGGVVELAPTEELFTSPQHPYTRALLSAAPVADLETRPSRFRLFGEVPSPIDLPPGCRLAGRCPLAQPRCHEERPPLVEVAEAHLAACPVLASPTERPSPSTI